MDLNSVCKQLSAASQKLASLSAAEKNKSLEAVAKALDKNRSSIIAANGLDIKAARANGIS